MFENVFEAINEKMERLKTELFLKDCEIDRLKKENEELKADVIAERENAEAWREQAERGDRF